MLDEHLGYVADRIRLERFEAAVAAAVRPGDRVADLGCGSGVLGLLCLQAGAGRVIGIDSTAMLEVARRPSHGRASPNGADSSKAILVGSSYLSEWISWSVTTWVSSASITASSIRCKMRGGVSSIREVA